MGKFAHELYLMADAAQQKASERRKKSVAKEMEQLRSACREQAALGAYHLTLHYRLDPLVEDALIEEGFEVRFNTLDSIISWRECPK